MSNPTIMFGNNHTIPRLRGDYCKERFHMRTLELYEVISPS